MPRIATQAQLLAPSVFVTLAARRAARKHDVLPLHIGDTYRLPPVRLAAPPNPDDPTLYKYLDPAGELSLRQVFAQDLQRRGLSLSTDEVIVTAGATHGLLLALMAILEAGDEVIHATPYWALMPSMVRSVQGKVIEAPLFADLALGKSPAESLAPYLSPKTRAIYLASPNNPDGTVLSEEAIRNLVAFAEAHDLWILADEVYEGLVYEGEPALPIQRFGRDRVISAYSLSKSYALAGIRLGMITASKEIILLLRRLVTYSIYQTPLHLQRLGEESIRVGAVWLEESKAAYRKTRDLLARELDARFAVPRAGAYLFLDLSRESQGDIWRAIDAALDAGFSLAPGELFGSQYREWARFCFTAAPYEAIAEKLPRLQEAWARLRCSL